jgi:quercetin dioxygenase-like cupin family protein
VKKTGNQFYIDRVGKGDYPEASIVPTDDTFDDERGTICNLLLSPIMSVARITSKRGSVRANHYHLTDWHYTLVESGEIYYFKRQIGSTVIQDPERMPPGTMFFTPPNVEHAMLFTEDTVFFTFAKNIRSHNSHESDLVRVTFITDEIAGRYL